GGRWGKVSGFGIATSGSKWRGFPDHLRHRAAGEIAGRCHPVFKKAGNVFLGPVLITAAQSGRRNIRRPLGAIRRPASETLTINDSAKDVAGAMTFRAMPRPVHEVSTAVILRRL